MPIEETPVMMRNDDVGVTAHPRVCTHDAFNVKERSHRPIELDVLVERHEVARNADAPDICLDHDNLGPRAVPAEAMDRDSVCNLHLAIDELEPVADIEQVEGKLGIVVQRP